MYQGGDIVLVRDRSEFVLVSQVSVIAKIYTSCWLIWFEMSVLLRMDLALVMLIAVVVNGLICGFDVNMTGIRLSSFVWIACARRGLLVDDWLQWRHLVDVNVQLGRHAWLVA